MHMCRKKAGASRANVLDQKEGSRVGSLERISMGVGKGDSFSTLHFFTSRKPESEGCLQRLRSAYHVSSLIAPRSIKAEGHGRD
jgi:hypothetical protein